MRANKTFAALSAACLSLAFAASVVAQDDLNDLLDLDEKPAKKAAALQGGPAAQAEIAAAIAMALHLYFNGVHDEEPTQITIKNVERSYSPWNSKLYGMNNLHR